MTPNDTFGGLDRKMTGFAAVLTGRDLRRITTRVANAGKGDVLEHVARDVGADRRLSGWPRVGQLGARYKLTSDSSAILTPSPQGPMAVVTFGRKPKPRGLPKRNRRKVYATRGGFIFTATPDAPARQGATTGKGTFTKAAREVDRKTGERVHREVSAALRKAFT